MSEAVWIIVFVVFIIIIVVLFYAFSGNTAVGAVNNCNNGMVNGGVVLQPGVGYVAATNVGAGAGWSTSTLLIGFIIFIIIIALIIWAVYPRRPVVVPPPPLPPVVQPVTVSVPPPAASQEYHYIHEVQAPPPSPQYIVQAPPQIITRPPIVAPVAPVVTPAAPVVSSPIVGAAVATGGRTSVASGVDAYGHPVTYTRTSAGGGATFDPDPVTTQTVIPGYDVHGVFQHSNLGPVSGEYHQDPRIVTRTTDVGRHQVLPAGRAAAAYIGPGARYAGSVVRSL